MTPDLAGAQRTDPLLWTDALGLYNAPAGSDDEILGATLLVGLGYPALRMATIRASATCLAEPRETARRLFWTLREFGLGRKGILEAARNLILSGKETPGPTPEAPPPYAPPTMSRVDKDGNPIEEPSPPQEG